MDRLQVEWMTTVYRCIGLGALTAMWISSETGPSGLLLILMLIFFMLLRWRFPRLVWTILLDQGAILYFTQMWEGAQAALVLTTFEAALSGQPYLAVPSALMALMLDEIWVLFFARSRSLSRTFTTCLEEPTDGCFSYLRSATPTPI